MTDIIGLTAGVLTTLSMVPQVFKTWRTQSAGDLSMGMLTLFLSGVLLWLFYGIQTRSTPIVLANAATLVLTTIQIGLTWRYRRHAHIARSRRHSPTLAPGWRTIGSSR